MKSKLTAPGTKRLKLKYDNRLSSFAFKFNLRCYNMCARVAAIAAAMDARSDAIAAPKFRVVVGYNLDNSTLAGLLIRVTRYDLVILSTR